ncbi:VOC family protein [Amycolatopsis cynarae]|uniref:VOC family protein n=1 Tax=Amycolatopsis cynarae TaxID=2995223 RepID=A0ABY7B024_9PSEU|nr:VOC family protein [Amycolatopsis sp. HUAS 11-8]WAL65300.1 VOC family protein [Amycolatopsis sp. HUAS 11-8]
MSAVPTFGCVVLDCPDPGELARFYAALLEWPEPVGEWDGHWFTVTGPQGVKIAFQRVEGYRPPEWPGQAVPQQFHLDLDVADLDAGQERALALGSKLLDDSHETFRVYADPAGHPFCLCVSD